MAQHPQAKDESTAPDTGPDAERRAWEAAGQARAEAHGGLMPLADGPYAADRVQLRLHDPAASSPAAAAASDTTEAELNALIVECRHFMREIVFHSARLAPDAHDRIRFVETACKLADTGARVAETIARLRGREGGAAEHRQRIIVERMDRVAAEGEGDAA